MPSLLSFKCPSIPFAKLFSMTHIWRVIYTCLSASTASSKHQPAEWQFRPIYIVIVRLNDLRELFIRVLRSIQMLTGTTGNGIPDGQSIVFSPALRRAWHSVVGIQVARGIPKFRVHEPHDTRSPGIISSRGRELPMYDAAIITVSLVRTVRYNKNDPNS